MKLLAALLFSLVTLGAFAQGQVLDEHLPAGPFPVPGPIFGPEGQQVGTAKVYPQYVEIFNSDDQLLGKVGIIVSRGAAQLQMVNQDKSLTLIGYAKHGRIFDREDNVLGTYFWTPTYSFVYDTEGKRVGSTKCIAWPRVCSVGVAGYLLRLIDGKEPKDESKP